MEKLLTVLLSATFLILWTAKGSAGDKTQRDLLVEAEGIEAALEASTDFGRMIRLDNEFQTVVVKLSMRPDLPTVEYLFHLVRTGRKPAINENTMAEMAASALRSVFRQKNPVLNEFIRSNIEQELSTLNGSNSFPDAYLLMISEIGMKIYDPSDESLRKGLELLVKKMNNETFDKFSSTINTIMRAEDKAGKTYYQRTQEIDPGFIELIRGRQFENEFSVFMRLNETEVNHVLADSDGGPFLLSELRAALSSANVKGGLLARKIVLKLIGYGDYQYLGTDILHLASSVPLLFDAESFELSRQISSKLKKDGGIPHICNSIAATYLN